MAVFKINQLNFFFFLHRPQSYTHLVWTGNDWHIVKAHTFQPLVIPFFFYFCFSCNNTLMMLIFVRRYICIGSPRFFFWHSIRNEFFSYKNVETVIFGSMHLSITHIYVAICLPRIPSSVTVSCLCVFRWHQIWKCNASDARCKSESNVKMSRKLCWIESTNDDHIVRTEWLWPTASIFDSMQVNFCFVVRATHIIAVLQAI